MLFCSILILNYILIKTSNRTSIAEFDFINTIVLLCWLTFICAASPLIARNNSVQLNFTSRWKVNSLKNHNVDNKQQKNKFLYNNYLNLILINVMKKRIFEKNMS